TFMAKHNVPPDQKRKWLEFLGLPAEFATRSLKDLNEAMKEGFNFEKNHPTNMKVLHDLDDAFTKLDMNLKGFGIDLTNEFGEPAAHMISNFAASIDKIGESLRKYHEAGTSGFAKDSIFGRLFEKMTGVPGSKMTPQGRIDEGFSAFDHKADEDAVARGTTKGLLDAFRQLMGFGFTPMSYNGAGVGSGRMVNAAYHPSEVGNANGGGGGSSPKFGNDDFPLKSISQGQVPKSVKGTVAKIGAARDFSMKAYGKKPNLGSAETEAAIADAAKKYGLDANMLRGIASIESNMHPQSNWNRATQYKGLFQMGRDEWAKYGSGSIYNAHDNAMAAAHMLSDHAKEFKRRFGRDPTPSELYMIHQQGMGFFTRGAMTNIGGNPYPGMRGPQSHDSFMNGWGKELARRTAQFDTYFPEVLTAHGNTGAHLADRIVRKHLRDNNGGAVKVDGSANVNVNFSNMPKGTRTSANVNG
ncbi:transglycosylase SLT domain-containing protein, partial [Bradyrhizobium macuxiense]|uniref:transglycosylase SLT domain-containing protein n=1 Tax=Bradyrhizobium macuxiense TaxID=1755647 RepID=UPI000A8ABC39